MSGGTFSPLRHRTFLMILLGSLFSHFGNAIQSVGAAWQLTITGQPADVIALVQSATNLPIMLLALPVSPSPSAEEPFLAPAAVLAVSLAGAIVSVLGASIVTAQLLGSIAALTGGWCLVQYFAVLRGGVANAWGRSLEFLALYAVSTALMQVALLAPKAHPVALVLSALPPLVAALVPGPLGGLVPSARPSRPLVAGLLIAAPAGLAMLVALIWAPHGAALGY